jgi:hypothetical protein
MFDIRKSALQRVRRSMQCGITALRSVNKESLACSDMQQLAEGSVLKKSIACEQAYFMPCSDNMDNETYSCTKPYSSTLKKY